MNFLESICVVLIKLILCRASNVNFGIFFLFLIVGSDQKFVIFVSSWNVPRKNISS